ncbi:MAG: amino acid adenylation domain-containing protein [Ilumatobacter sp.]|uniref:amino acid adenylation domain-containing protein n=1 Tax=Ilumatobacter sp. TaxID=1967498 RepID=UPI002623D59C|nr:amino acid adenylation domain-containing protein [Ilumatobacter sp.]MDJ0767172.1 amino acid adenylation domain-containing protein [Ilumatobacter sp.]
MSEHQLDGVADIYPMAPTQAGMVFHTVADPERSAYTVQVVTTLRGPIVVTALERAWQSMIDRHDILRTAFVWERIGQPLQVVRRTATVDFAIVELAANDEAGRTAELERLLEADRRRGFDLDSVPSSRVRLVTSGADDPTMVWSFHHAMLDGWSAQIVLSELLDAYGAILEDREWTAPTGRPFKDFVAWLERRDLASSESFWRDELAGFTTPTALPIRRFRRERAGPGGAQRRTTMRQLPTETGDRLTEFARRHRLTLATVVQGAWSLVLSRYSGARDVVFGATSSGRPMDLPGVEQIVGMFLTTVPVRSTVDPADGVVPWLARMQAHQLEIADHEHTSLVEIQRWSDVPAGVDLFDSIVVVENVPSDVATSGMVGGTRYLDDSNFPLALIVLPRDVLTFKLVSDPTLFASGAIDALFGHLLNVLGEILQHPDATLGELGMVSESERDRIGRWNDTGMTADPVPLVHEMIEREAAARPDRLAVACAGSSVTYGELARRADACARALREAGVRPGSAVVVHLERSVELIVSIVGVLQAGGAYVPVDPAYPSRQLREMVEDSEAALIVTSPSTDGRDVFGDTELVTELSDESVLLRTGPPPPSGERRLVTVDDLAYMIYTSGSTGRPNGVPIDHRNLLHSMNARFAYYEEAPDVFLLLSSLSFDSSVVGVFWTLTTGGTLVVPTHEQQLDVRSLQRLIQGHRVTHTLCLPSIYQLLLDHVDADSRASLRTVIVAGEACPTELVDQHARSNPGAALFNEYGPTEASVWATVHRCDSAHEPDRVPIGRPIANTQVVLLDSAQQLVPVGVPGEIYIGGGGLARGYHRRPEMTAARFVDVPSSRLPPTVAAPGEMTRLFRTGDIGQYRPDGLIDFHGRMDEQVKVRGHRVELGGIEEMLVRRPDVVTSAVVARSNDAGTYLVAYVEGASAVDGRELLDHLRSRLPAYMVPSSVLVLDSLPRLPNGKVDRSALPEAAPPASAPPLGPRDELERTLHAIWSEVLPDANFGVDDDFFEAGGHSIVAVSLVERIRQATGRELPLASLLEDPTITGQARLLRDEEPPADPGSVVALNPEGSLPPLFLVPPAGATALIFRELARHIGTEQPLYAFQPLGIDGDAGPESSIAEMAARYLSDMRSVEPAGPYRVGGMCMGAHVAWEMADLLARDGADVDSVVVLDSTAPDNGPDWTRARGRPIPIRLVRFAVRGVRSGTLVRKIRARLRRRVVDRRVDRAFIAHRNAQRVYEARPLDVDLLLVQSEELAADPDTQQRWRRLARGRVEQLVVHDTTHSGLLWQEPREIERLGVRLKSHLGDGRVVRGATDGSVPDRELAESRRGSP